MPSTFFFPQSLKNNSKQDKETWTVCHVTREICTHLGPLVAVNRNTFWKIRQRIRTMPGSNRTRQCQNLALKWINCNHHLFVYVTLVKSWRTRRTVFLAGLRSHDQLLAVVGSRKKDPADKTFQHLSQKDSTCISHPSKLRTVEDGQCPQMESQCCQEGMCVLGYCKVPKVYSNFFPCDSDSLISALWQ